MRIRQVKPAFWSDERIADWTPACRLFYIGLWMQADDTGWLRWDTPRMAAELYPFDGRAKRERDVAAFADRIEATGRLLRYPCGHAFIPRLVDHQRLSVSTKQVKTFQKEHDACMKSPAGTRGDPTDTRVSPPGIGNGTGTVLGTVRDGTDVVTAPAREVSRGAEPTEFDEGMAAAGYVRPRVVS